MVHFFVVKFIAKLNTKGYSLIESAIVLGVMAVISMATAQVMVYTSKENSRVVNDAMSAAIVSEIRLVLMGKSNCQDSTAGVNPTGTGASVNNIIQNGTPVYSKGNSYGFGKHKLRILESKVYNFKASSNNTSGKKKGYCIYEVELDDDDDNTNNNDGRRRKFRSILSVGLDTSNNIESCELDTVSSDLKAVCDVLGGTVLSGRCVDLHTEGTLNVNTNISADQNIEAAGLNITAAGAINTTNFNVTSSIVTPTPTIPITTLDIAGVSMVNGESVLGSSTHINISDATYNLPVTELRLTNHRICSHSSGDPYGWCMRVSVPSTRSDNTPCPLKKGIYGYEYLTGSGSSGYVKCNP